jgi:hypothetical protein
MRLFAALLALLVLAVPVRAQVTLFAENEFRGVETKDQLRAVQTTLATGSEGAKKHAAAVSEAFKGTDDWAPAVESYFELKGALIKRAAALEGRLNGVIAQNAPERAEAVKAKLDAVCKVADVLRSDYEFYMRLPELTKGPQRRAAQAAMRLLSQTKDYPVAFAYFLGNTPGRPPFAPLKPGVMSIRHR